MDHLILPDGVKPWFKLTYNVPEESYYERKRGKSFFDFPQMMGWKETEIFIKPKQSEGLLGGVIEGEEDDVRGADEVEAFFQTWLLFGLVYEVFALSGIEIKTTDFFVPFTLKTVQKPQEASIITTAGLPSLILRWKQKHQTTRDRSIFEKAMAIIDRVGEIIDYHCANGKDQRSTHQYGNVLWPVSDVTTTSIIAVAVTLRKAARLIYDQPNRKERWPVTNSKILRLRIQRKWCPSDAAMIMEDFDIDGQSYIAAAEGHSLEELDAHCACTDHSCEAKLVEGTYVTKHAEECTGEIDYDPEPRFLEHLHPKYQPQPTSVRQAVMRILDEGQLPVLRWDFEQKALATFGHEKDAYHLEKSETPPFVAISHVWADGMGNPFDNSLPQCQFERIQNLVNELGSKYMPKKKSHPNPGFWIDTVCCLVGLDAESKEYKDKSIKSMREIYHASAATLVIDPWLMEIPTTATVSQICHRVYCSGWSRRLWTHQEGFLADNVFLQFKDRPLSLEDINELAKDYEKKLTAQGYPFDFPVSAASKTSFYYTNVKRQINDFHQGNVSKNHRWTVYQQLAESLAHRSTTNVDDELLCVSSVMALDVEKYLDHKYEGKTKTKDVSRQRTADLRMEAFLEDIGHFNQSIIFNNYRRLRRPGFRWAPASLLGHRASGLGSDDSRTSQIQNFRDLPMRDTRIELESLGVKFNLTKYMTRRLGMDSRVVSMILDDKRVDFPTVGLPVDYPGYTIRFSKNHGLTIKMAERRFGLKHSILSNPLVKIPSPTLPKYPSMPKIPTVPKFGVRRLSDKATPQAEPAPVATQAAEAILDTYHYVVLVAENNVDWKRDVAYAIILQKPLGEGDNKDFLAMIGLRSIGPGDRIYVQSLCSAVVRAVPTGETDRQTVGVDWVEVSKPKDKWVVT